MWVRSLVALLALVLGLGVAHAGPKQDIQSKIKEAMENYDLMDYDAARKSLNQALAIAKKAKLDKDPLTAKAHLSMGIVAFVNNDPDAAKLEFLSAVQIDPKIQIDAAYKSAEMAKLLDEARKEAAGGDEPATDTPPPDASGPDCASVKGLEHKIIDTGTVGQALPIEALVGSDVTFKKVALMYRPEGATDFVEVPLKKDGECKYTGSLPASAMKGSLVHYYVAAFNEVGKPVASKGSAGSPNIIELTAATGGGGGGGGGGDNENPIGGGTTPTTTNDTVPVAPKKSKVLLALAGGAGSGYVTGETEAMNQVKNCCLGGPSIVFTPELGFYLNGHLSLGAAARIGIPLGANVEGHATAAPGGLLRVRYATGDHGQGLRLMGQAGIGVLRNTIKLDNAKPGMDTDVVAQGPLLLGAGIGFAKPLSSSVSFIADVSILAGIQMGTVLAGLSPKFNSGVGADLSIGVQFGL